MPTKQRRVLVTGARGAIGRAASKELRSRGHFVRGFGRNAMDDVDEVHVGGLTSRDPRISGIVLLLTEGVRVDWGRPSGDVRPHLPGESKRAALAEFLESGIDPATVERVSLRWDETIYTLNPAALASAHR